MASLWVDKHRPTSLTKLSLHGELTPKLLSLANSADCPHLLFFGPNGGGKKTRVMALLREMFGPGVERVKLEHRAFKTSTNKAVEITTLGSNYHIECNASDAGNSDRFERCEYSLFTVKIISIILVINLNVIYVIIVKVCCPGSHQRNRFSRGAPKHQRI